MFLGKLALLLVFTAAAVTCNETCKSNTDCPEGEICVGDICVNVNDPTCPENMHFVKCASTCRERCGRPKPTICNKMCFIGCICDDGYVLDADNKCVKREDCPPTGNETKDACATIKCAAGYECLDGKCILRRDCPLVSMVPPSAKCVYLPETDSRGCLTPRLVCSKPDPVVDDAETQCGENAHMSNCTNFCPPIHCGNLDQKIVCFSLRCGPPGCVCKDGYVFKTHDKSLGCVKRTECTKEEQPIANDPVSETKVCGPNEHYTNCGTACEPTCGIPEPRACTLQCIVGVCQCNPGYFRHETKGCVPQDQC